MSPDCDLSYVLEHSTYILFLVYVKVLCDIKHQIPDLPQKLNIFLCLRENVTETSVSRLNQRYSLSVVKMESVEKPFYRICTTNIPAVFQIDEYESKWAGGQIHDEIPKITGTFAYVFESTLSRLFKSLRANISLVVEKEIGMKKDGTLTGCYRSIRDNESDVSIVFVDFPTIDYEKVDPYQIVMEDSVKILSGYHSKAEADVSFNDFILTSMKSFDDQTWFAVLVIITAFFGLWMIKRSLFPDDNHVSLRRKIAETLWDTLLLFISQESTDYDKFLDRFLSILMTLSFFFLTNIYFGLMSTDLVSVTKPTVINSYQDIMNRPNMTPVFAALMSDTQDFEDAYADSTDSTLATFWEKYKDRLEMADTNANPGKLIRMVQGGANLNRVLIMSGFFIDGVRKMTCRLKIEYQLHENVYTWVSRDPHALMRKKVIIMRNGMKQTRHLKKFRQKLRYAFETGIFHSVLVQIVNKGLTSSDQFTIPEGPHSQVEKCLSDQVIYADASVDTVVMQNYYLLFAVAVVMLPASVIVLLIELYCHRNAQVGI